MSELQPNSAESNKEFLLGQRGPGAGRSGGGGEFRGPPTRAPPRPRSLNAWPGKPGTGGMHVEWSTNEKVACEGAGAAAVAGLTSLSALKNAGLAVALDFLTHLSLTGLGDGQGSMVVVVCDDPEAHSSGDETDTRWQARFAYAPMLEPTSVPEAREMIRYCFDLSRRHGCFVFLRSYTRLSHASSILEFGPLPPVRPAQAHPDPTVALNPYLGLDHHKAALNRLENIKKEFEASEFNQYFGPEEPELLVIASGNGLSCAQEALTMLGLNDTVGLFKIATIWPFPVELVRRNAKRVKRILVLEEVDPLVEVLVKDALNGTPAAQVEVLGKESGHVPVFGEITPDRAIKALQDITGAPGQAVSVAYESRLREKCDELLVDRGLTWCPGCPHRASFWALEKAVKAEGGEVFVTGDIGCYTLDVFPGGKHQINMLHAMGSSIGLANGLGQLGKFGWNKPVVSICGDSTFFHAALPGLINAIYNQANVIHVILDNGATAMTGFQAHPGGGIQRRVGNPLPRWMWSGFARPLAFP